jgi:hypothetical protein
MPRRRRSVFQQWPHRRDGRVRLQRDQLGGGVLAVKAEAPLSIEDSTISSNHAAVRWRSRDIVTGSSVIKRSTINNNFVPSPGSAREWVAAGSKLRTQG